MAIGPIPPWEIPPDYIGAMSAGAKIGLDRANLETQANEAADRLRLSYAELAGRGAGDAARENAAMQLHMLGRQDALSQWAAEHAMKQQQLDLAAQREKVTEQREQHRTAAEQLHQNYLDRSLASREQAELKRPTFEQTIQKTMLMNRVHETQRALNAASLGDATHEQLLKLEEEAKKAMADWQAFESGLGAQTAAATHPADPHAPFGWVATPGGPGIEPVLRPRRENELSPGDTLLAPSPAASPDAAPTDTDPLGIRR
jgi:hypothetical protein